MEVVSSHCIGGKGVIIRGDLSQFTPVEVRNLPGINQ